MNIPELANFPSDTQVWVYGFSKPLAESDKELIRRTMDRFLPQWVTHGQPVDGGYAIVADRFVLLAGRLESGISGCSIDSSVRNFKTLRDSHGLDGLNRGLIFFRDRQGTVQSRPFTEFQKCLDSGEIDANTMVFDTTIGSMRELRERGFEVKFGSSWHARSFSLPTPASQSR